MIARAHRELQFGSAGDILQNTDKEAAERGAPWIVDHLPTALPRSRTAECRSPCVGVEVVRGVIFLFSHPVWLYRN